MSKDRFNNELAVGDFVVYAVGRGHSSGGQRFGRVTSLEKPTFTNIETSSHLEFDNPDEQGYDYEGNEQADGYYADKPTPGGDYWSRKRRSTHVVIDGYKEMRARTIGGFNQVVKLDIETALQSQPDLLEYCKSL